MRFKLAFIITLFFGTLSLAQTDNDIVNQYLERYIENSTDQVDIQQFASDLLYFFDNPINLNKGCYLNISKV